MSLENSKREQICMFGEVLYSRGLAHGTAGNISVRLEDGLLVTPTNSCLGRLDPATIAKVDYDGNHLGGNQPSKEAFMHRMCYSRREQDTAVVHLHSTHAVAVSCMDHDHIDNVLPPLTAYHVMRVGRLPLAPYFPPGDERLGHVMAKMDEDITAVLLANHGPIVSSDALDRAVYAIEELEETAKLFLLLQGFKTNPLSVEQVAEIEQTFKS